MKKFFPLFFLITGLCSCVKDKPSVSQAAPVNFSSGKKVYVVNEGNFLSKNASVSLYDPATGETAENIFYSQNQQILGDVAQSICYNNSSYYVVVNNSGKIAVCDENFRIKTTISGFSSPRYILPVSNSKAYVTDLSSNAISVLNLNTNAVTATIPCPGWTEKMALVFNKVFVTNVKKNYLYVINAVNNTKTDSIDIGPNASCILSDKNDKLWVLSGGDITKSQAGFLKRIDPVSHETEMTFNFPPEQSPSALCINRTKDTLYFLCDGICRLNISAGTLPSSPFIQKGSKNFYGLGVNQNDYTIYAADVLDYIQRSNVYIYDAAGQQKKFFKAGVISNGFYFE